MNAILNYWKNILEQYGFGVCQYLGEKMSLSSSKVRLYFIYATFLTMGSPLLIYLALAFWVNIKKYVRRGVGVLLD